jgi:predicted nucleic acid-binding protein
MMTGEYSGPPSFVDANIILRYLLRDVPEQADQARRIVEEHPRLLVTEGMIAETGYVLTRVYTVPREVAVDALIALLRLRNVGVHGVEKDAVIQALMLCRPSGRVSFADAMLWAVARSAGPGATIHTLDRRFPAVGVAVRDNLSVVPQEGSDGSATHQ